MQKLPKDKFYRPITHKSYKSEKVQEKLERSFVAVPKLIYTDDVLAISTEMVEKDKSVSVYNHKYIAMNITDKGIALIGGGFFSFLLILHLWKSDLTNPEVWGLSMILFTVLWLIPTLFCAYYYFKVPTKVDIMDRMRGTITFNGMFFKPSITMPFSEAIYHWSQGGTRGLNAFKLLVVNPKNNGYIVQSFGDEYKQSISFITWYMDKNRPLPPGTAFDPYREADFERRKAERFPSPLYPSQIPTPEATEEQQAERDKFWRDVDFMFK